MTKTKTSRRKLVGRRGKFLVAMLAVTAAFAGGTQTLAPTSASARTTIYNECTGLPFWEWVQCEWDNEVHPV
jgi:hypothetical protein